jgi:hypothetical protein
VVWWSFLPKSRKKSGKKIISKRKNFKKRKKSGVGQKYEINYA